MIVKYIKIQEVWQAIIMVMLANRQLHLKEIISQQGLTPAHIMEPYQTEVLQTLYQLQTTSANSEGNTKKIKEIQNNNILFCIYDVIASNPRF